MNLNHAMFSFAYAASAFATGLAREAGMPPATVFAAIALIVYGDVALHGHRDAARCGRSAARLSRCARRSGAAGSCSSPSSSRTRWRAGRPSTSNARSAAGAAEGAFGPAILGLTMGIGRLMGQVVAERVREAPVILGASALAAFGLLLSPQRRAAPVAAYIGFGIAGLGVSVIAPMALALVGRNARDSERTKAISRAAVIGFTRLLHRPARHRLRLGGHLAPRGVRAGGGSPALVPAMLALLLRARAMRPA
jgi:hypothetical protein